jgi:hypothetical protein
MQDAILVISENNHRFVRADSKSINHSQYPGIFQCPECHEVVEYVTGHHRGKVWVKPKFRHNKNSASDCSRRTQIDFSIPYNNVWHELKKLEKRKRGQSHRELEKSFLNFVRDSIIYDISIWHSSVVLGLGLEVKSDSQLDKKINRNKGAYSNSQTLIDAAYTILKDPDSEKCIARLVEQVKESLLDPCFPILDFQRRHPYLQLSSEQQQAIRDNIAVDSPFRKLERFQDKESLTGLSCKAIVGQHCQQLIDIIHFLRHGSSPETCKKFLEIVIFGDIAWPVQIERIVDSSNSSLIELTPNLPLRRFTLIKKREFHLQLMRRLSSNEMTSILNDDIRKAVLKSINGDLTYSSGSLIDFVLLTVIRNIQYFDWSRFPLWYKIIVDDEGAIESDLPPDSFNLFSDENRNLYPTQEEIDNNPTVEIIYPAPESNYPFKSVTIHRREIEAPIISFPDGSPLVD